MALSTQPLVYSRRKARQCCQARHPQRTHRPRHRRRPSLLEKSSLQLDLTACCSGRPWSIRQPLLHPFLFAARVNLDCYSPGVGERIGGGVSKKLEGPPSNRFAMQSAKYLVVREEP